MRRMIHGLIAMGWEALRLLLRRPLVGVLAVALDERGALVLIRRADTDSWGLPGGMVDYGERVEEALARELREETGHRLVRVTRVVGVYSAPERDPRIHSVCVVVEAEVAAGAADVNPLEVRAVGSFAADALPAPLAYDTKRLLDDWRATGPAVLA
jgi:ADP-ribose pyrophosphatase YjhB (NUDIX family)